MSHVQLARPSTRPVRVKARNLHRATVDNFFSPCPALLCLMLLFDEPNKAQLFSLRLLRLNLFFYYCDRAERQRRTGSAVRGGAEAKLSVDCLTIERQTAQTWPGLKALEAGEGSQEAGDRQQAALIDFRHVPSSLKSHQPHEQHEKNNKQTTTVKANTAEYPLPTFQPQIDTRCDNNNSKSTPNRKTSGKARARAWPKKAGSDAILSVAGH